VQPPGPALSVWVSSITSSAPARVQASRTPVRKPSSGSTIPMLVSAGSIRRQATSPSANAASTDGRSLNSATLVVRVGSTIGPTFPSRECGTPASSVTKLSSTVPW
jgi:hypothetical protein